MDGGPFGTGTVTTTTELPAEHALNPYRHKYHPDHSIGYTIHRTVTLAFDALDPRARILTNDDPPVPAFDSIAGYGDVVVGGNYEETIRGLFAAEQASEGPPVARDITVRGIFYLWQVSRIGSLNDVVTGGTVDVR